MIAFLVSEYPGLSHTFVLREVTALRKQGISIATASINTPKYPHQMTAEEKKEAKSTFYIKKQGPFGFLKAFSFLLCRHPIALILMYIRSIPYLGGKGLFYLAEATILLRWLLKEGIHHIHCHLANVAATVVMMASFSHKIAYSLSIHGPDVFEDVEGSRLRQKVKYASFVRAISEYCRSQVIPLLPLERRSRVHVVHCGIDCQAYRPRPAPTNQIPQLLSVGRLVKAKGQTILLEACKLLQETPFHLTLIGSGPEKRELEKLAETYGLADQVTFAGAVGQDAIHEYYDQSDLFVLASFAEGVPVVLMEAMAKGIPVIATRIAGIPELIEDGVQGRLVSPGNPEALAACIVSVVKNRSEQEQYSTSAPQKIADEYDAQETAKRLAALLPLDDRYN